MSTAVVVLPLSSPQASVQVLLVVPMRWERVFIWLTQPARSPPEYSGKAPDAPDCVRLTLPPGGRILARA